MVKKEDGFLFPIPLQGGEEAPAAWRGLEYMTWNRLPAENFFEKLGSPYLVSGWIDGVNPEIFLKMANRFVQ